MAPNKMFNTKNVTYLIALLVAASSFVSCQEVPSPLIAADRIKDEPESVWIEFIQIALEHKPLNLGQGFPDFAAPKYLIDSLHNATNNSDPSLVLNNQYTRSFGHPRLVKALVKYYSKYRNFSRLTDANEQVLVTVGAYEALFVSIMAFVNPGDEVVIIDPAFDAYEPMVKMAQGKSIFVPLRQLPNSADKTANFRLDMKELESKVTNKTKVLILNNPNNPLGKVFSLDELEAIGDICKRHNLLVIADEVYEHFYYDSSKHSSIANLPGMWQRTISVGSAGKTFSVTGWKVGWALGPSELMRFVQLVHQATVYTVATPLQEAIARSLEHEMELLAAGEPSYWASLRADLKLKRDRMATSLQAARMSPIVPEGGYFMLVNFSSIAELHPQFEQLGVASGGHRANSSDFKFARWMARSMGLQAIPASAFYSAENKHLASNLIRFCFIKQEATLDALEAALRRLAGGGGGPKL